jgi:hypothetical protein
MVEPRIPPTPIPPPPPPPPAFIAITGASSVSINAGQSVSIQLTVVRSRVTAAISLGAVKLPQGVTAAFSPTSLPASSDSQQFTLTLTAAASAPAAQPTVQVVASATGVASAYASIPVTVVSPYSFTPGAPILTIGSSGESTVSSQTPVKLAAYEQATIPLNLQISTGVSGTISFAFTASLPSGITAQFNPVTLTAPPQPGYIAVALALTAGADIALGTFSVSWEVQVSSAMRGVFTFPLDLVPPFVSAVSPTAGSVPMFDRPGTTVAITGGGFGPGTTVTFGADSPVPASSISPNGTSLLVTVPPTAASGQLTVVSPAGAASGAPDFAIDNYRNTRGFSWINSTLFQDDVIEPSYTEADATALFGAGQTTITVFGVTTFNPLVDLFLAIANQVIDAGGQCFGMSLGSMRFAAGQMSYGGLPRQVAGAEPNGPTGPDAWMLNGPSFGNGTNVSPSLATFVHLQQLAQMSQEAINNWVGFHATVLSAAALRTALQQAFTAGGADGMGAVISITFGSEGHAVVGYEIVDTGGGAFDILLYNPNIPFTPAEDSNAQTRAGAAAANVINVMSDGTWVLPNSDVVFGTGTPNWTGGILDITVLPWNTIPPTPTLPWAELTAGVLLAAVIVFVVGNASVSQVSDGQGHLLFTDGQWNVDPATKLPGVRPLPTHGGLGRSLPPAIVGTNQGPLIHTITGSAEGSYDLRWIGAGYGVEMTGVPTTAGSDDTVIMHLSGVDFTAGQNKTVTAAVTGIGSASGLPRTARVQTGVTGGAVVSLSFDHAAETFSLLNEGEPTSYTLELASFDSAGHATSLTAPAASLGKGDTVTFNPNWDQLGTRTGIVSIRTAAGDITNSAL